MNLSFINCVCICVLTSFYVTAFLMFVLSVRCRWCISRMEAKFRDLLMFNYLGDAYDFNHNNHVQNTSLNLAWYCIIINALILLLILSSNIYFFYYVWNKNMIFCFFSSHLFKESKSHESLCSTPYICFSLGWFTLLVYIIVTST